MEEQNEMKQNVRGDVVDSSFVLGNENDLADVASGIEIDLSDVSCDIELTSRLERERKLKRLKERKSQREKRKDEDREETDGEKSNIRSKVESEAESLEARIEPVETNAGPMETKVEIREEKKEGHSQVAGEKADVSQKFSLLQIPVAKGLSNEEREKIEIGVQELFSVIKEVPVLDFLRGRIAVTMEKGLDFPTLLGFFRISARMLKEEYEKKRDQLKKTEAELEDYKRIAEDLKTGFIRSGHQSRVSVRDLLDDKPKVLKIEPKAEVNAKDDSEEEMFMLKEILKQKDKKIGEFMELLEKQKTDFNNYRSRSAKEVAMHVDSNFEDLVSKFLPVIDNFERALEASKKTQDLKAIVNGIEMIRYQFEEVLRKVGVESIKAQGEAFNPKLHECIQIVETDDYPDETVVEEVNRGYTAKNKLLRPALVKISKRITNLEKPSVTPPSIEVSPEVESVAGALQAKTPSAGSAETQLNEPLPEETPSAGSEPAG